MFAIVLSLLFLGQDVPVVTGEEVIGVEQAPVSADDPLQQAARALQDLDWTRLQTEPPYAEEILDAIDLLRRGVTADGIVAETEPLRMFALVAAGRREEASAAVDRMLADRPETAMPYGAAWFAALRLDDIERAIRVVELATQTLRANEWPALREVLEEDSVWSVFRALHARDETALRVRLAEALLQVGWPGYREIESLDELRTILIEDRMSRDERSRAAAAANGIATPRYVLNMILQRDFDGVLAPDEDRLAVLARAMSDYDRISAERLAAAPDDMERVLDRAQFLRGLGRESDALALLEPFTQDVAGSVARDDQGMWVVNEAAYALVALGRSDEATALTAQLASLPIESNPELISPSINHSAVLLRLGRNAEALAYTLELERERASYASDYGKMWIYRTIVCSLERLGGAAKLSHG